MRPLVGAELILPEDERLLVLVKNRAGCRNLCRLDGTSWPTDQEELCRLDIGARP